VLQAEIEDQAGLKSVELLLNGGFEPSQKVQLAPASSLGPNMKSLKIEQPVDLNKDGVISLEELITYVQEHVKQETADQQHPIVVSDSYDPQLPLAAIPK